MIRSTIKPRLKTIKCKHCRESFTQERYGQNVCTWQCGVAKSQADRQKKERKEIAVRKVAIKTRSDYIKEAQVAFNKYIRFRDKDKPCICCGKPLGDSDVGGSFDAGHYRSVGSAPHLRFDERNVHGQRKQCNRYGAGRAVDYRIGLIERIGQISVDDLERDNTIRRLDIDALRVITAAYKAKLKELA